tara:strand:+ start:15940 stop:16224 length:285 start_codon:yes stop_codon:yes gene_type:complete
MKTANKIRLFFIIAILLGMAYSATAQETPKYKIEGNEIVKTSTGRTKTAPKETQYTHTIKGKTYKVFQGSKGGYFIIRTSKKSGKEYKQYLKFD